MKKLLIVSPHFPPINAPDMQRVRMSLSHYKSCGWEPVVLTVDPDLQTGARDDQLMATLPAGLAVRRAGALPLRWSRLLGLGTLGLRAWYHLWREGTALLRSERFDLVFFSNTQFVTFALGRLWRRRFSVPYVLDVQDPWRTDYYQRPGAPRPPGGWKYQFARLLAWLLEGWSFRGAAGVMSVSEEYLEQLRERYRWFGAKPSAVIRFGASERDLEIARALPPVLPAAEPGVVRLVYAGIAGPVMRTALSTLLQGLKMLRDGRPDTAARLRLYFIGTTYAGPDRAAPVVAPLAAAHGVGDLVVETPVRIGFLQSLRAMLDADAILILGAGAAAYSPSKIYPAFLAGKPLLALAHPGSRLEAILKELGGAILAPASGADGPARVAEILAALLSGDPVAGPAPRNEQFFQEHYLAESLTRRQAALFDAALARDGR